MKSRRLSLLFVITGAVLILAALSLLVYNRIENNRGEKEAKDSLAVLEQDIPYQKTLDRIKNDGYSKVPADNFGGGMNPLQPELELPNKPEKIVTTNGIDYIGVINIPAMDKTLPVTSGCNNRLMKKGACRYAGTVNDTNLIICAHNLPAFFKGLADLNSGDTIIFIDPDGQEYVYEITETIIVDGYDIEGCMAGSERWDITLFSCTYGGKQRVLVRAELVNC